MHPWVTLVSYYRRTKQIRWLTILWRPGLDKSFLAFDVPLLLIIEIMMQTWRFTLELYVNMGINNLELGTTSHAINIYLSYIIGSNALICHNFKLKFWNIIELLFLSFKLYIFNSCLKFALRYKQFLRTLNVLKLKTLM